MKLARLQRIIKDFFYREVECRIKPRQKWATKVIPRTFTDIDYVIEEVTFAALINYWENDNGEATCKMQYTVFDDPDEVAAYGWSEEDIAKNREENKLLYDEMAAAYAWAKSRAAKTKEIEDLTMKVYKDRMKGINTNYEETWKLEEVFTANDTLHLGNIVKYRKHLWS